MIKKIKELAEKIEYYNEQAKKYWEWIQSLVSWVIGVFRTIPDFSENKTAADNKPEPEVKA